MPGGGSSVHGYFTALEHALSPHGRVITFDPPGLDPASGRRWLTLCDHASWLADAIRREDGGPVVVVGHSLGGLVALRLALDEPDVVAGLLLLDPSPPIFGALLPRPLLWLLGFVRKLARHRGRLRSPRSVPFRVRVRWYFLAGGTALAADIAAAGMRAIPAVVVLAGEHQPGTRVHQAHARLTEWTPDARLEVWAGATHGLASERPQEVAAATRTLMTSRSRSSRIPGRA